MSGAGKEGKNLATITIPISGMHCAACSARVERGLRALAGVSSADVNLLTGKGIITYDPAYRPRRLFEQIGNWDTSGRCMSPDLRCPVRLRDAAEKSSMRCRGCRRRRLTWPPARRVSSICQARYPYPRW